MSPSDRISPRRRAGAARWLVAGAAALISLGRPAEAHAEDEWWAKDKAYHFGVSAGLAASGYALSSLYFERPWQRTVASATFALSAGIAKELWDLSGHGDPSFKDLAWDGIGTSVGVGLALAVDLCIFRRDSGARGQRTGALVLRF